MVGNNLFLSVRGALERRVRDEAGERPGPAECRLLRLRGGYFYNSYWWFYSDRPHPYGVLQAQYFNDNLLGMAHEMKFGFEVNNNTRTYTGTYYGTAISWTTVISTRPPSTGTSTGRGTSSWTSSGSTSTGSRSTGTTRPRPTGRTAWPSTSTTPSPSSASASTRRPLRPGQGLHQGIGLPVPLAPRTGGPRPRMENFAALTDEFFGGSDTVSKISACCRTSHNPMSSLRGLLVLLAPPRRDMGHQRQRQDGPQGRLQPLSGYGPGTRYNRPYGMGDISDTVVLRFWWADGYGYGGNTGGATVDGVATWDELYWAVWNSARTPITRSTRPAISSATWRTRTA